MSPSLDCIIKMGHDTTIVNQYMYMDFLSEASMQVWSGEQGAGKKKVGTDG
jgi:hypothetical protein